MSNAPPEALSRSRKIEVLTQCIAEGTKLGSGPLTVRLSAKVDPIAEWRGRALEALKTVGGDSWCDLVAAGPDCRPALRIAVEHLAGAVGRITARRTVALSDDEADAARLRAALMMWGDHIIDLGSGTRQDDFFIDDYHRFLTAELPAFLEAVAMREKWPPEIGRDAVHAAIALAGALDEDSLAGGENAEVWHAGWALLTIAWWIGESVELPIWISRLPMVTFAEARATFRQYRDQRRIECPRCAGEAEVLIDEDRTRLASILWRCVSCNVAGYFPFKPHPKSEWATQQPDAPASLASGMSAAVTTLTPLVDLSWMSDATLRRIAEGDAAEMEACFAVDAWKATLLLAGSATEAMLLDVLERNPVITRSHLPRPADFPDKTSLEQLVSVARAEGLLTATSEVAPAMRAHRDLIHPNRVRAGKVTIDRDTVDVVHGLVRVIARDLRAAADSGRLLAFAEKA